MAIRIVTGTEGADTITNDSSGVLIQALGGRDSVRNEGYFSDFSFKYYLPNNVSIDGGDGNDILDNGINTYCGNNVSINGGNGNDFIHNDGIYSTLIGGNGADSIVNYQDGTNASIDGGAGNDYLRNDASNTSISGGDGNDSIGIYGTPNSVYIEGGKGDDSITNDYNNSDILYKYSLGDGNDTIVGFSTDDTLRITGGSYTTATIGVDVIVYVGDGSILLRGAAYNSTLNIVEDISWKLIGTTATYGTSTNPLITVSGVKSLDGISLSGNAVTVANSSLNQSNVTISDGYTLKLASDVTAPQTTAGGWSISGYTATYKGSSTTAGYQLINNAIIYTASGGGTNLVTVDGVKSTSGLSLSGNVVTVANSALNQSNVTISDGYTLKLASDVTAPQTTAGSWDLSGNTAVYKASAISTGYQLANNQISYVAASGGETLFTVSGVKSTSGLTFDDNKTVTVAASALGTDKVTISDGYTLALGSDVTKTSTTPAGWSLNGNVATYKNAYTSAGYSLANNQIVYSAASGGEAKITISGVKSLDGISQSGSTITVSNDSLNQETVTVNSGYTLALDYDVKHSTTKAAGWTLSGTTAAYKSASTTEGYQLVDNRIVYNPNSGGDTLVTVSGVKSTGGLNLSGSTVTVGANALNQETVTISDGYTLAIADDVQAPIRTEGSWSISGNVATYKSASITAGYKLLASNQIKYSVASGGNTLVTVSGVKSLDGLSLSGSTVTVGANALNQETVTISDGYTLAIADDVQAPIRTEGSWSISGTTAAYKSASTTAGYQLLDNRIVYNPNSGGDTLVTVSGVKSLDGLSLNGSTVTVGANALNQSNVTISDGYTLALAAGVDTIKEDLTAWTTLDSGNVAYLAGGTGDYYSLSGSNKITYHQSIAGSAQVELSGVKGTPTISNNTISLAADNFASDVSVVSNAGGYDFILSENLTGKTFTGGSDDDTIENDGYSMTIDGGAGNDYIYNYGDNVTFNYSSDDGNDKIYGFDGDDTLSISGDEYIRSTVDNDIIITVGDGKISLIGAASLSTVHIDGKEKATVDPLDIVGKATADTINNSLTGATIQGLGGNDKITNSGTKVSILGGAGNDSIKNTASKVSIVGDSGKDTIINSGASVTVDGGADNDKISNTGARVSIFGGTGNDSIKNTAKTVKIFAGDGNDTIVNSKGASVSIDAGDGNDKISNTGKSVSIFGGAGNDSIKNTAAKVTIHAGDGADTITNSGASVTVDSGADNDTISNTGASVSIIGGTGNDSIKNTAAKVTITGGTGNDTITNSGANVLIKYAAGDGNDLIEGFRADSTLQIGDGKGTYSTTKNGDDIILTVGDGSITLTGATNLDTLNIAGKFVGNMLVLDNKSTSPATIGNGIEVADASTRTKATKIVGNALDNSIVGGSGKDSLYGGDGDDTLAGGASNDKLYGQNGDDSLYGGAGNDSLNGSKGEDTLWGGTGNDTLTGSTGNDLFVYSSGKDVITDYAAGDMISLGAAVSKASISGNNVVLNFGSSSKTLTIKNAKHKELTFIDATGEDYTKTYGKLILDNAADSIQDLDSDVEIVDATKRTKSIRITGNDEYNTILGGAGKNTIYGGEGTDYLVGGKLADKIFGGYDDDTLVGGKGNDTLWGGDDTITSDDGADTFIYNTGDGKDVIVGFDETDKLQLTGVRISDIVVNKKSASIIFSIDTNNSITFKKCATEVYNINGYDYEIKNKVLVKVE